MGLIADAFETLTKLIPARVPLSSGLSLAVNPGGIASSPTSALGMMTASGWVFAVIDRIGSSLAATNWRLYQQMANGDREEVLRHPALNILRRVNPFMTYEEYIEILAQNFELVGEMWTIIVPTGIRDTPYELWPVRPDHIRPVPHPTEYITGYIYQPPGVQPIPLALNQVIFIRRPNPLSAYRGLGVVQSILMDVESERSSAQWTANFFRNSAEPGGIIEVEEAMADAEFEKFVLRWRQQHQGASNAHRVAVLEGGMHWKDRQLTQRDMQFEQLRKLNRDTILGAWGISPSIVGVTEHVNRANAEAAELTFANRVIIPRLRRIRGELNESYIPLFNDSRVLFFDYDDPTPPNRELALLEASQGFDSGYLTQNEARRRVGEDAVEGGDEFKAAPPAFPGLDGDNDEEEEQKSLKAADPAGLLSSPLEMQEKRMERAWAGRLRHEAVSLAAYLEQFKAIAEVLTKLEPSDIGGYDWDWWTRFGDDVIAELERSFILALRQEFPDMPIAEMQRLAADYARARGAELLTVTGEINLVDLTRRRVGQLVAETLERGDSLQTLQKRIRADFVFSPARARMVARTETATALGQGVKEASIAQGRDEKHWVTQGDDIVDPDCVANEDAGWIKAGDLFPSGRDTVPQHPSCRCVCRYRTSALHEDSVKIQRHAVCGKLLMLSRNQGHLYCRHCKKEV